MKDVIIIGAGPIGLYLANLLEKRLDILVLDRKKDIGDKADSGLYSVNLGRHVPIKNEWVEHNVDGAILHSPIGREILVKKKRTVAHVVDRIKFVKWLSKRVKSRVILGVNVKNIKIGNMVAVETNKGVFKSKMVIGCDGALSIIRKHFGVKPKTLVNGLSALVKEKDSGSKVHLYFDKEKIEDGFFWKIPRGDSIEYGALGRKVNFLDIEKFFKIKKYEKKAAPMNLGYFRTSFNRSLLVGEAAGQVKPWSFGGVVYGFTCSEIARDVIFEAFEKNRFDEKFLQKYDKLWKKRVGKQIKLGLIIRDRFIKMDNKRLEKYFHRINKIPFLNKMDMDFLFNLRKKN